MEFVEKIRKLLRVETRYKFAKLLRKSNQSYETLVAAQDRITFRDLIALRRVSPLTDSQLLDLIEKELKEIAPEAYSELPKRS